jgi:hypothetical protein
MQRQKQRKIPPQVKHSARNALTWLLAILFLVQPNTAFVFSNSTYDTSDKRRGDFGYGWTLGIRNVRVEKNNILGLRWRETSNGAVYPTYCVEATRPHIVTVTMPDGTVEKFEARLQQMCQQFAPVQGGNLIFTPHTGTLGTLSVIGDNDDVQKVYANFDIDESEME